MNENHMASAIFQALAYAIVISVGIVWIFGFFGSPFTRCRKVSQYRARMKPNDLEEFLKISGINLKNGSNIVSLDIMCGLISFMVQSGGGFGVRVSAGAGYYSSIDLHMRSKQQFREGTSLALAFYGRLVIVMNVSYEQIEAVHKLMKNLKYRDDFILEFRAEKAVRDAQAALDKAEPSFKAH